MQSLHSREEFGRVSGNAVPLTGRLVEKWSDGALGIKAKKCYPTMLLLSVNTTYCDIYNVQSKVRHQGPVSRGTGWLVGCR